MPARTDLKFKTESLPAFGLLILYYPVKIKPLIREGKDYAWPRPEGCAKCEGRRIWGHGYRERYFDEVKEHVWVKRWRCADCGAVHTVRPAGYWRRFQAKIGTIVSSLRTKIKHDDWSGKLSPQRQQYWFRGLKKQWIREGEAFSRPTLGKLDRLIRKHVMAGTHSMVWFRVMDFKFGEQKMFLFSPPS